MLEGIQSTTKESIQMHSLLSVVFKGPLLWTISNKNLIRQPLLIVLKRPLTTLSIRTPSVLSTRFRKSVYYLFGGDCACKHYVVMVGPDPALKFGTFLHQAIFLVFLGIFDDVTSWAPIRCRNFC